VILTIYLKLLPLPFVLVALLLHAWAVRERTRPHAPRRAFVCWGEVGQSFGQSRKTLARRKL